MTVGSYSDLWPDKGNFHTYNHKVTIIKNSQGWQKYKIGIQCFPLTKDVDCTLCFEILNVDYQLQHKSKISIDKATSMGLTIGNVAVKKLSHRQCSVHVLSQTHSPFFEDGLKLFVPAPFTSRCIPRWDRFTDLPTKFHRMLYSQLWYNWN